jgi:rare lipoprotein A
LRFDLTRACQGRARLAAAALVLAGLSVASTEAEARRRMPRKEPQTTASFFDLFRSSSEAAPASRTGREGRQARRARSVDVASAAPAAAPSGLFSGGGGTTGVASYYHEGTRTASGERFNPSAMTAAHRTAPLGSQMRVTNLNNGRSIVVRINDRGPFVRGRIIDVSAHAADSLGFRSAGVARVKVERVAGE